MYFKRVNDTTITCVITEKDLQDNGIAIDDLFERKKEAMEYLRNIIMEAAEAEHFGLSGDYTSMRVTVLPDRSIALTLSENKSRIKVNDLRGLPNAAPGSHESETPVQAANHKNVSGKGTERMSRPIYGFLFDSMNEVIECCGHILEMGGRENSRQSLYLDEEYMTYYLFLEGVVRDDPDFSRMVLALNEFGDFFNEGAGAIAFIREHGKCIVRDNAAEVLASL